MKPFVVVASGPSAARLNLECARGQAIVIAVSESWRLCPWADFLYAADIQWWNNRSPPFDGIKVCPVGGQRIPVGMVHLVDGEGLQTERMAVSGRSSGVQAVNFAYHLGAERIAMVGFDMHDRAGTHWHDPHEGMPNPTAAILEEWRVFLDAQAPMIASLYPLQVVNCSPTSALVAYPKISLEDFMKDSR